MAFAQLTVDDFSGGFTDNYIDNQLNRCQRNDNFILTTNKKLLTRPGSTLFDSNHYDVIASGNPRINTLFNYDKDTKLFAQVTNNLYHTTGTWAALTGPVTGNVAFSNGSASSYTSHSEWNKHLFLTDDQYSIPQKVFLDDSATAQIRNAGLPAFELAGAIALANSLKSTFNTHIADAAEHTAADTTTIVTAADAYDLATLITLVSELLGDYTAHDADAVLASPTYHQAQTTANSLTDTTAPTTLTECLDRLDDLKAKYNLHDADSTSHTTGGTHAVSTVRVPTITPTAGANTWLYQFHYSYEYNVGNRIFLDFGPTSDTFTVASATTNVAITTIPVLANGAANNWDTATIKIQIYRTKNNGTVFYKVGEVTNGTTTFSDTTSDAAIDTEETIYTTGGVVDNDPPLPAKYVHVVNGYGYWGAVKEGSQEYLNRVYQSIQDDPDSVPATFFIELEDDITGISSVNTLPVVFTKKWAYRLEGTIDELGRGDIIATRIVDGVGCISNQSIVQTTSGLFYAGIDGFYYTDGYRVLKISNEWNNTYASITNTSAKQKRIVGVFEQKNQRIYWTAQREDTSSDNDSILVLDLRFGVRPDSCFTTWSNGDTFAPTSLVFFNGELVRSDRRGYLLKHQDTLDTDPEISVTTSPTVWASKTIIWDYISTATDFGSSQIRKFVNRIVLQAKNVTNTSIQIKSFNDDNRRSADLKIIRYRNDIVWGDPDVEWGDADIVWGWEGIIEANRRFPAQGLRCSYKQIQITNAYSIIKNSDTKGPASIDATAKTVTLLTAGRIWPTYAVGYYISFAADGYVNDYLITARNSDTVITYMDALGTSATAANSEWVIRGYVKGEKLHLLKYVYQFVPMTDSQEPFPGTSYLGGNA